METNTEDQVDQAMENPSVVGIIVADTQGLCITQRGEAKSNQAGQVAALCQEASKLVKQQDDMPVIVLETVEGKQRSMIIKQKNVCTGVIVNTNSTS